MTAISLIVDQPLRRTVQLTGWLKKRPVRLQVVTRLLEAVDFAARGTFHVWRQRRSLTFYKLFNIALVNIQFKLKTEFVVGRPYRIKIEPTNICNTKCQLCPTGVGLEGRPKGKMTYEQFTNLIDRFKRFLVAVDLSMWGDPLIVPDIYRMIRYAHDKRLWTYTSSNLHAYKLGKGQDEQLVRSGLNLLTCSLHGASQHTYEMYQPGKRLDECIAKVREIIATRDRLGSATPEVQLNFVVTRSNEHERGAFRKLAADLGCEAVFSAPSLNVRFTGKDKSLVDLGMAPEVKRRKERQHITKWLPKDTDYALEPYRRLLADDYDPAQWNGRKLYDCQWPWRSAAINWDGSVVTCCGSFDSKMDMGNVFESSLGKVWNGSKYRMARRSYSKPLSEQDAKDNPCASCPGFLI